MDQEVSGSQKAKPFYRHVAGDLRNPALVRMRRDSRDVDQAATHPNEMDIKSDESVQGPYLGGKEIRPQ